MDWKSRPIPWPARDPDLTPLEYETPGNTRGKRRQSIVDAAQHTGCPCIQHILTITVTKTEIRGCPAGRCRIKAAILN